MPRPRCAAATLVIGLSFVTAVAAITTLFAPRAARAAPDDVVTGEMGRRLDKAVLEAGGDDFRGAVLVARGRTPILAKGYGFADAEREPMTIDHLVDVGSIAKQFTAAAILALESEGKLRTDDPVAVHLRRIVAVPSDKAAVTIHHLLTHTAGIPASIDLHGIDIDRRDAVVARVLAEKLEHAPGDRFTYSNAGYFLLAAIVEEASGTSFERCVHERIFERAGMRSTGFIGEPGLDRRRDTARIFELDGHTVHGTAIVHAWNWANRGATGVITTARDLYLWHCALEDGTVLGDSATRKLFTAGAYGYAYGWYVAPTSRGTRRARHRGATLGYGASFTRYFDESAVVIVLADARPNLSRLDGALAAALFPNDSRSLEATMNLHAYVRDREGRVAIAGGARFVVLEPASGGDSGEHHDSEGGVTLAAVDPLRQRWPLVVRMEEAVARELLDALDAALESRGACTGAQSADAGVAGIGSGSMDLVLAPGAYAVRAGGAISLPAGLRWRIEPGRTSRDEDGRRSRDERLTLVLADDEARSWPATATLDDALAARLAEDLRRALE